MVGASKTLVFNLGLAMGTFRIPTARPHHLDRQCRTLWRGHWYLGLCKAALMIPFPDHGRASLFYSAASWNSPGLAERVYKLF